MLISLIVTMEANTGEQQMLISLIVTMEANTEGTQPAHKWCVVITSPIYYNVYYYIYIFGT